MASVRFNVFIVVYPRVNILDVAGPVQVFTTANESANSGCGPNEAPYRVNVVAARAGLVETTSGINLGASALPEVVLTDRGTVLVAGGHGAEVAGRDGVLTSWLRSAQPKARRFGCICTGAFVLAGAQMLTGRRVATHWAYCDRLQASNPDLDVERDAIFVEEDGFWSSAGITAGMDLALAMVEQDLGRDIAMEVARRLVVFLKRPGGQSQFSMPLKAQTDRGPLAKLGVSPQHPEHRRARKPRLRIVGSLNQGVIEFDQRSVEGVATLQDCGVKNERLGRGRLLANPRVQDGLCVTQKPHVT